MTIFPEKLQQGDVVALIAPSSPIAKEEAERCIAFIKSLGYQPKAGKSLYSSLHGYEAGDKTLRAAEIHEMFRASEVKAIFCVRGGDSSCHVVDLLDLEIIRANPKFFVGYSDVTNYHTLFNRTGLVTFHGPMVKSNMIDNFDDYSRQSFWQALHMDEMFELQNPPDVIFKTICEGAAEGILTGGNLALVTSTLGTPYGIETRNKILFLEEVNESVVHVDRMLHHLKYAGKFAEASGVILGAFTGCENEKDSAYGFDALVADFFCDYAKPVLCNIQAGHCFPTATLPLGATCAIDAKKRSIVFRRG